MMVRDRSHGLDGVLVLVKPPGPTSHDVVALVRRLTGTRRVGHGGTLDPFASGVLPVFLGLATRLVEYHMGDSKAYRATVCFGARSTTDDRDGELEPVGGPAPTRAALEALLGDFRGRIEQRPPAYSALKVGGRRAYELAREGQAPELAMRSVTIDKLELVSWDASDPERPVAVLDVECGAGTYIRALARDMGDRLGCGAYLGALVRSASGPFRIKTAHSLDDLRDAAAAGPSRLGRLILPIDAGLDHIPTVALAPDEIEAVARGQQVRPHRRPRLEQGDHMRLLDGAGTLVGMAVWKAGRIVPEKVFVAPPPRAPRPDVAPQLIEKASASGDGSGDGASGAHGTDPLGEDAVAQLVSGMRAREPRLRLALPAECVESVAGIENLRRDMGPLFVAVGVFDGLHRGHLYLLRHLRRAARAADARPAVITFDAHPDEVLRGVAPPLLCDPAERLVRLAASGAQVTVVQHFDAALRETPYERFVAMIRDRVDVAGFLMTPDAAFGYERRGTPAALKALGERDGFAVETIPPLLVDGEPVRSSQVRREIATGGLAAARMLLGRSVAVSGVATGAPGGWAIRFDLPVALPPAGRYGVLVGPAWTPGAIPEPASERHVAVVSPENRLFVPTLDAPGRRIRVVFAAGARHEPLLEPEDEAEPAAAEPSAPQ